MCRALFPAQLPSHVAANARGRIPKEGGGALPPLGHDILRKAIKRTALTNRFMNPLDIFAKALNLPNPWLVTAIELKPTGPDGTDELHIQIDFVRGSRFPCSVDGCGQLCPIHDTEQKTWRHLNFFQYRCYIHARVPRTKCDRHGAKLVDVPWARPHSGFTLLFEGLALSLASEMPVDAVARQLGEHDTRLWRLIDHWVTKGIERQDLSNVTAIGIDETSRKGHNYISVAADLETSTVLYVTKGKDHSVVDSFSKHLKEKGGNPEDIAIATADMSAAFSKGIAENFKNAVRVVDKFHVIKLFTDATDRVRRREAKDKECLKKTRYIWLKNVQNLTEAQLIKFNELSRERLETGRAYRMRCAMQDVYKLKDKEDARTAILKLCSWMRHGRVEEMKSVAETIKDQLEAILAYWDFKYTNALLEGLNSIIQTVKRRARGFRTIDHFRTVIMLTCGKLGLNKLCPYPTMKPAT